MLVKSGENLLPEGTRGFLLTEPSKVRFLFSLPRRWCPNSEGFVLISPSDCPNQLSVYSGAHHEIALRMDGHTWRLRVEGKIPRRGDRHGYRSGNWLCRSDKIAD